MVLCVKSIPDAVGNEYSDAGLRTFNKDTVLAGARQVVLNGTLGQILQLVTFSHELFAGLIKETTDVYQRVSNVSSRLNAIAAQLPDVDGFFMNTNYEDLHTKKRVEYHGQSVESSQLLNPDTKQPSFKELYERTIPPPNLSLLDEYNEVPGEPCLKLYSNPNFFVNEWVTEMEKQRALAKEKRKERKKQKEEERARAGISKKVVSETKVEAKPVERTRYDPHTGQRIVSPEASPRVLDSHSGTGGTALAYTSSPNLTRPPPDKPNYTPQKATTLRGSSSSSNLMSNPPPVNSSVTPQLSQLPTPAYVTLRGTSQIKAHSRIGSAPSPSSDLPPPPAAFATTPVPPLNMAHPPTTTRSAPPPAAPKPPPPSAPAAPPPPNARAPPPSAPPPSAPVAPPLPSGGGLAAALAAKGQSLKAAPEELKAKPANSQSDLLKQIQSGMKLKTNQQQNEEKKEAAADNSVAAILARRIALADSDSEGDESDEWSE